MERRRRTIVGGVLVVLVLAAGVLVLRSGGGGSATTTGIALPAPVGRSDGDPFAVTEEAPVTAPPGSAAEVATAFLDAEVAGDVEGSFPFLSADDREEQDNPAGWLETHADLWTPTAYRLASVTEDGDTATATAEVTLDPELDPFVGLVPARARLTLPLVQEDGAWRVAFAESAYEPGYPDEAGAVEAVRTWAEARTRCSTTAQWDGGLLDSPYLADALCGAEGDLRLGPPDTLDALDDAGAYLDDFGAQAADWARVVPVEGPVDLDAVAAPLGDSWVVIGTSPRGSSGR